MLNIINCLKRYKLILIVIFFVSNLSIAASRSAELDKINIEITSHLGDKQSFIKDDVIRFLINLDVDAYLTVIYQTAEGKLVQLLPNQKEKNTLYKAGLFISVPSDNVPYQFTIQPPYGKEKVWVFASDNQSKKLSGKDLSNGLRIVSMSIKNIQNKIKASSVKRFGQSYFILKTSKNN